MQSPPLQTTARAEGEIPHVATRLEQIASLSIILAAFTVTAAVGKRAFFSPDSVRAYVPAAGPPTYVSNWETLAASGRRIGSDSAKVTIVEFGDLECPFCRRFSRSYQAIKAEMGDDVALVFVHFPIDSHRFARPAARAAECAAEQGRFAAFLDAVFEKQDSLGLKPWASFARDAGEVDSASFERCVGSSDEVEQIRRGLAIGNELGIAGTPTILVNGWRYGVTPYDSLSRAIRESLTRVRP